MLSNNNPIFGLPCKSPKISLALVTQGSCIHNESDRDTLLLQISSDYVTGQKAVSISGESERVAHQTNS